MIVWRYEDSEGIGPYWARCTRESDELLDMAYSHQNATTHPKWHLTKVCDELGLAYCKDPETWAISCPGHTLLSGIVTEQQLDRWFSGWEEVLRYNGFRKVCYAVSPAHSTRPDKLGQLVFIKEHATREETRP